MSRKRVAVAFSGPSNSGKTTLIQKVARVLIYEHKKEVAIIKHDSKGKARFDVEGKDSYKFYDTGAEVIVTSPTKTTLFSHKHKELDEMIRLFNDFDILLVEGLKTLPLPRICLFRDSIDESYFPYMDAIALDKTLDLESKELPSGCDELDVNDPYEVVEWIYKNAKEV